VGDLVVEHRERGLDVRRGRLSSMEPAIHLTTEDGTSSRRQAASREMVPAGGGLSSRLGPRELSG
jgi:hypothetical protein